MGGVFVQALAKCSLDEVKRDPEKHHSGIQHELHPFRWVLSHGGASNNHPDAFLLFRSLVMKRVVYLLLAMIGLASCGQETEFGRPAAVGGRAALVLTNGKVVTVDKNFSIKEGVTIQNGRFVAVGSAQEVRLWIGPNTRVVNLAGRTMIPGLIDSHIHATVAG